MLFVKKWKLLESPVLHFSLLYALQLLHCRRKRIKLAGLKAIWLRRFDLKCSQQDRHENLFLTSVTNSQTNLMSFYCLKTRKSKSHFTQAAQTVLETVFKLFTSKMTLRAKISKLHG